MISKPEHEVTYQELIQLMRQHGDVSALEMLAIASNLVGKLVAMQDQAAVTPEKAMEVVAKNIEIGNRQAVAELAKPIGSA